MRRPTFAPPILRILPGAYPFAYARKETAPPRALSPKPLRRIPDIDLWTAAFFREDGSADTHDLLVDMTRTIRRTFKHARGTRRAIQPPVCTLHLGSGSCRDLAVLMIAGLRPAPSPHGSCRDICICRMMATTQGTTGGNTHAWVQATFPARLGRLRSVGWRRRQSEPIRVAVAHHPREAIPLQGTWFGTASDHLAMKVAVKVTTAAATGA